MKKRLDLIVGKKQIKDYSCGPNAIKQVIHYKYRLDIPEKYLMKIGETSEKGTSIQGMMTIAEKFKLDYRIRCNSSISDLINSIKEDNPVILLIQAWGDGHYVVAYGYDKKQDKILYYDPFDGKKKSISSEKLNERWNDRDKENIYNRFGMFFGN